MISIGPSILHDKPLAHRCRIDDPLPEPVLRDLKAQLSYWDDNIAQYISDLSIMRYCLRCGRRLEGEGGKFRCPKCNTDVQEQGMKVGMTFPRGLLDRVLHVLSSHDQEYTVNLPKPAIQDGDLQAFPRLRPYQQAAVMQLDAHAWGLVSSPPRSGKTLMMARDWVRRGCPPAIWLCDTIVLAEQSQRALQGYCPTKVIGLVGDGECDVGSLTVMTAQSAHVALKEKGLVGDLSKRQWYDSQERPTTKYDDIVQALTTAEHLIRDEAHHATQPMDAGILRNMQSAWIRRGASGTPWDTQTEGLKLEAVMGSVVFSCDYEYLFTHGEDMGWGWSPYLLRPQVTIAAMKAKRYSAKTLWAEVYADYIRDNEERNGRIAEWTRAHVGAGRSVAIIVRQTTHGDVLAGLLPEAERLYGKHGREQRHEVLTGLAEKRIMVAISTVMGEGIDSPTLDCVVNAAGEQSAIPVLQRMRAMTPAPDKQTCYVLDFADQARWLSGHAKKREELYETMGFTITKEE